jgi:tRNA(fMet)-specific endonuclease VapC
VGGLIDTRVLIEAERGRLDVARLLDGHADETVEIAAITASELLHGVHRLKGVARARASLFVERLLETIPVVPFDLDVARVHAALSAELRAGGTAVGAHDLLIAATAVYTDAWIATRDLRSFPKIKGLDVRRI